MNRHDLQKLAEAYTNVHEGTMDIKGFEIPEKEREAAAKRVKEKTAAKKKKNIRGYDSEEQKKRLEKKRGMKLDDHPQFKKEEVEQVDEGKSDRPLGVMHQFARGVKQKRGAKKDEGGKYLGMQHTKKQNKKEADRDAYKKRQRNERGLSMYPEEVELEASGKFTAEEIEEILNNDINEVLGGQPGDGYVGHPRLKIKNPMSPPKKETKVAPNNKGLAGRLGNRATEIEKMLGNSYEPEGETIEEGDLVDEQAYTDPKYAERPQGAPYKDLKGFKPSAFKDMKQYPATLGGKKGMMSGDEGARGRSFRQDPEDHDRAVKQIEKNKMQNRNTSGRAAGRAAFTQNNSYEPAGEMIEHYDDKFKNAIHEVYEEDIKEFTMDQIGKALSGAGAQVADIAANHPVATAATAGGALGALTGGKKKVKKGLGTAAGAALGAAVGGVPGAVIGGLAGNVVS